MRKNSDKFSRQRGPQPFHNFTQTVRAYLGLTQDQLAMLMQVSRAAVSMDEYGTRALPWPQVQLLHALHQALPPGPAAALPVLLNLTASDRDDLDFRRQGLRLDLYPLRQKLARQQVQLAQARCWQQILPQLHTTFPTDNAHAHEWLDHFEKRAANTLRNQAGAPALLQVRLAAIEFEIAEITQQLGAVAGGGEIAAHDEVAVGRYGHGPHRT